jgi:transposase InsO family protein
MTRTSVWEYAAALRPAYLAGGKGERGRLLSEFCRASGYHRKAAIRLLGSPRAAAQVRRGRPSVYGAAVVEALVALWEAGDRACGKRLAPFLPELLTSLERHDELAVSAEVREQLLELSAATIDRLLRPARQGGLRRPWTHAGASTTLRAQIPVRTFGEWAGVATGSVQADLVAHCGESTEGFHLWTLTVVDVATSWTECMVVWGKGQERVSAALHEVRGRLPMGLRELHTDNGSEFLNHLLAPYCLREGIRQTRGRPYQKNDQAYVEQKNGAVVRRLVGYDRYSSHEAQTQLARLYGHVRLYGNFFQPVRKLVSKERVGARVVKRYDRAQTPYQRLLAMGALDEAQRQELAAQYAGLNPLRLRQRIDAALEALWKLSDRPDAFRAKQSRVVTACG